MVAQTTPEEVVRIVDVILVLWLALHVESGPEYVRRPNSLGSPAGRIHRSRPCTSWSGCSDGNRCLRLPRICGNGRRGPDGGQ